MKKTRVDESRKKLVEAFYFALGGYTEQEAKKEDQWRDQSIGQLYAHLKHEVEEIRANLKRNDRLTFLLHNCVDAVCLSTILLSKVMDMAELTDRSPSCTLLEAVVWEEEARESYLKELKCTSDKRQATT